MVLHIALILLLPPPPLHPTLIFLYFLLTFPVSGMLCDVTPPLFIRFSRHNGELNFTF